MDILHQFLNFGHYHINQLHRLVFADLNGSDKLKTMIDFLNQFFGKLYKRNPDWTFALDANNNRIRDGDLERKTIKFFTKSEYVHFAGSVRALVITLNIDQSKDGKSTDYSCGVAYPNVSNTIAILGAVDWEALPELLQHLKAGPKRKKAKVMAGTKPALKDSLRKLADSVRHLSVAHAIIFKDEPMEFEAMAAVFKTTAEVMVGSCEDA